MFCFNGGLVQNCSIAKNTGQDSGGGISCDDGGTIQNSIIYDNTKVFGTGPNYYNTGSNITYSFSCSTPLVAGERQSAGRRCVGSTAIPMTGN